MTDELTFTIELPDDTPANIRDMFVSVYNQGGPKNLGRLIVDRIQGKLGTKQVAELTGYSPTWIRRVAQQAADQGETWVTKTTKGWHAYYSDWMKALSEKKKK